MLRNQVHIILLSFHEWRVARLEPVLVAFPPSANGYFPDSEQYVTTTLALAYPGLKRDGGSRISDLKTQGPRPAVGKKNAHCLVVI